MSLSQGNSPESRRIPAKPMNNTSSWAPGQELLSNAGGDSFSASQADAPFAARFKIGKNLYRICVDFILDNNGIIFYPTSNVY
jgi:hypothetical protein